MKKSFMAACVGAPLLALAIGAPTTWAAPGDNGASVSINGDPKHTSAGSTAISQPNTSSTTQAPNVAVAVNGSTAFAGAGPGAKGGNRSIAVNGSFAQSGSGDSNMATAINGSGANAGTGGSQAIATCGGNAQALGGTKARSNGGSCGG